MNSRRIIVEPPNDPRTRLQLTERRSAARARRLRRLSPAREASEPRPPPCPRTGGAARGALSSEQRTPALNAPRNLTTKQRAPAALAPTARLGSLLLSPNTNDFGNPDI